MALHVFEARYKEMVAYCLDEGCPFGIALIRRGNEVGDDEVEPYLVGTTAVIRETEEAGAGGMNLIVQGAERFRIRSFDESRSYLVARVQELEDDPWEGCEDELQVLDEAQRVFGDLAAAITERLDMQVHVRFNSEPSALSFAMAGMLSIAQIDRQRLLEVTSAADRFEEMLPIMRRLLEELKVPELKKSHYSEIRDWLQPN